VQQYRSHLRQKFFPLRRDGEEGDGGPRVAIAAVFFQLGSRVCEAYEAMGGVKRVTVCLRRAQFKEVGYVRDYMLWRDQSQRSAMETMKCFLSHCPAARRRKLSSGTQPYDPKDDDAR
jgi:hypothetical protein